MKTDIDKYDYFMFVDASGDDGFKFDKESSKCYTVAAVIIPTEDVLHNLTILNNIKKCIGAKPEAELKYNKLRRNKRYEEIIGILSQVKGVIYTYTALKEQLSKDVDWSNTETKQLSKFTHIFPIETATTHFKDYQDAKILIVIDVMKKVEMDGVNDLIEYLVDQKSINADVEVIFRDSKDKNFILLQLADLFAGFIRNFAEQLQEERQTFNVCKVCFKSKQLARTKNKKLKCTIRKKVDFGEGVKYSSKEKYYIRELIHLLGRDEEGLITWNGLSFIPVDAYYNFLFMDCIHTKSI